MFILTADQIRQAEKAIMEAEGITSLELMDRAVERMFPLLLEEYDRLAAGQEQRPHVLFLCGTGNNGGDGVGLARLLHEAHPWKAVVLIPDRRPLSHNTQAQLDRLPEAVQMHRVSADKLDAVLEQLPNCSILVDALFGSGLSRPLEGLELDLVLRLNAMAFDQVISIDVPSGVSADGVFAAREASIQADVTYSVLAPKPWELLADTAPAGGEISHVPLTEETVLAQEGSLGRKVDEVDLQNDPFFWPPARTRFGHKGTYGHALLVGGSLGKTGAIQLSGMASLHAGSGLTTLALPDCGLISAQTNVPEAMCLAGLGMEYLENLMTPLEPYSAIGVGPGMGRHPDSAKMLSHLFLRLREMERPPALVLDADALNILSEHPEWLELLPENTVLTPHPKEFDRLANGGEAYPTARARLDAARAFAVQHKVVLVLKGGYSFILSHDEPACVVGSGAPELATGGTGDVLTGIITSLVAQGMVPFAAAVSGCYLHGIASQLATGRLGEGPRSYTLTAGDVARNVGLAMHNTFGTAL